MQCPCTGAVDHSPEYKIQAVLGRCYGNLMSCHGFTGYPNGYSTGVTMLQVFEGRQSPRAHIQDAVLTLQVSDGAC